MTSLEPFRCSHSIPHLTQQHDWDCGIICLHMMCKYFNIPPPPPYPTTSIWSIDLMYMLYQCGIQASYSTITVGVDTKLKQWEFYKNELKEDEIRVNQLFQLATSFGIPIHHGSMSTPHLLSLLSSNVLLMLVDNRYLSCATCRDADVAAQYAMRIEFAGHFILVTGVSEDGKMIQYVDPDVEHPFCTLSVGSFDLCRKSFGTDEDIIIIPIEQQPQPRSSFVWPEAAYFGTCLSQPEDKNTSTCCFPLLLSPRQKQRQQQTSSAAPLHLQKHKNSSQSHRFTRSTSVSKPTYHSNMPIRRTSRRSSSSFSAACSVSSSSSAAGKQSMHCPLPTLPITSKAKLQPK